MDIRDLKKQLDQKIDYLNTLKCLRDYSIQCKANLLNFVSDSERRLDESLRQESQNPYEISWIKEQLDVDKLVYATCEDIILEHHADIEMTKIEIDDLKRRISALLHKKIDTGFYKKRKYDFGNENNQNCGIASYYLNINSSS